jgi:hypothetical protein
MAGNALVAANIAQKLGKTSGNNTEETMVQEPGSSTDTLVSAIKSLQAYTKMTQPGDPDVSLVRKIISEISRLIVKDQSEGQGMSDEDMIGGMGGGETIQPPTMPDLSKIVGGL